MLCLQDTIVAIRKGGDKLVVGNLVSDKYPTIEFSTDPNQVGRPTACMHGLCLCHKSAAGIKGPHPSRQQQGVCDACLTPSWDPSIWMRASSCSASPLPRCIDSRVPVHLQEVDTGKHTWANYFLAAYKVETLLPCSTA